MTVAIWIGFIVVVLGLLALDLGVFNRKAHVVSTNEALGWTAFWVALALAFNGLVWFLYDHDVAMAGGGVGHLDGQQAALQFFTAYVVEKSLSLDNIFVIAMVFSYFKVPPESQHRVLFWGILGALVLRGAMIAAGLALIEAVSWIVYVFGGFMLLTAVRMMMVRHDSIAPDRNLVLRAVMRLYPVTEGFRGQAFFVVENGRRFATPLLLALAMVETTDVLFAVDSIPAVMAVTTDPFLVFTSNVFAILGLRSLYFALASIMDRFRYLKFSLVFVLAYVGVKMMLSHHFHIPPLVSLSIIGGILFVGVAASLLAGRHDPVPLQFPQQE